MFFDTSTRTNWTPFRMLALLGLWLAALVTLAVVAGGCGARRPQPTQDGSITLTWSIIDEDHQPTTCANASARVVALQLRDRVSGAITALAFPCPSSPGTAPVPAGAYDVDVVLHDGAGRTLATAPAQPGIVVATGQITRLAPVTFLASTKGSVALSIDAQSTTANCRTVTAGGAGISGSTIALERIDPGPGSCASVTFVRKIGTQEMGTYVANDCSAPPVATCIERNETLTANLPAGAYVMHVIGKIAANSCWKADAKLTVTAGQTLTTRVTLVRQPC